MTTATLQPPPATTRISAALEALGRLLEYPRGDFAGLLEIAMEVIHDGGAQLAAFLTAMESRSGDEREELYTATFDVNPRCVPYLSIHLFGEENFKRGEFMAALHQQYETRDFEFGNELPDHIGTLLRYAATLEEPERHELMEFCILGPLGKLIASLADEHPYRALLNAADQVIRAAHPGIEPALSPVEQMRQHGNCPTVSDGCSSCGPVTRSIVDGPGDLDGAGTLVRSQPDRDSTRTEVSAPSPSAHPTPTF